MKFRGSSVDIHGDGRYIRENVWVLMVNSQVQIILRYRNGNKIFNLKLVIARLRLNAIAAKCSAPNNGHHCIVVCDNLKISHRIVVKT